MDDRIAELEAEVAKLTRERDEALAALAEHERRLGYLYPMGLSCPTTTGDT